MAISYMKKLQLKVVKSLAQSQEQATEQVGGESGFHLGLSESPKTLPEHPHVSLLPGPKLSALASHSTEPFWQGLVRLRDRLGMRNWRTVSFQRTISWKH